MLSDIIVIEPRNEMLGVFIYIFLKWDISFIIPNKVTKLFVANLGTLVEEAVSQIFYLGLSLDFMTKNGKLFAFFQNLIF